jgi:cell division protein YceG involved in septum cleavage
MTKKEKVIVIISVICLAVMSIVYSNIECHYTRKDCKVICRQKNVITIEDKQKHLWDYELESGEDYNTNDIVNLYMYTNHTDNTIKDDVIVKVEK